MSSLQRFLQVITIALLVQSVVAQHEHQTAEPSTEPASEKTYLVDEFGRLGHCDTGSRIDAFLSVLSQNPTFRGYAIFYRDANALPGRTADASLAKMFSNHLAFRSFPADQVSVIDGGYSSELVTELWIAPPGGEVPRPSRTVKAPSMPLSKTFLFDRTDVLSEDSGQEIREFELPSVKAKREAENAEIEAEYAREQEELKTEIEADGVATDPVPQKVDPEPSVENEEDQVPEYKPTPEEIEAIRFEWVSERFGKLLADNPKASGVIVLYADDEIFDIARLHAFIEEGRTRIATAAGIPVKRITVKFGGYRHSVETEFWFVPAKGKKPALTPHEREADEPSDTPVDTVSHDH